MLTHEQYQRLHAAGWDAGNRSMKAGGRTVWNDDDLDAADAACQAYLTLAELNRFARMAKA